MHPLTLTCISTLYTEITLWHTNFNTTKMFKIDLTTTLIKHYSQIIASERKTLDDINQEITDHLKSIHHAQTRESLNLKWKETTKQAEDEARQLSMYLKESRDNKLHRKRGRVESQTDLPAKKVMQREDTQAPNHLISADILQQYKDEHTHPKNLNPRPNSSKQPKGKEPAHGRGYPRKRLPPNTP